MYVCYGHLALRPENCTLLRSQVQPLIIVHILLQMLCAKKPQNKHTLGVGDEGFFNQTWCENLSHTAWVTMDYVKAIFQCC